MDAAPFLAQIGRHLNTIRLDAVLIGNAAAALQGAPVTTVDFDFLFRKTPGNLAKLRKLADALGATVLRPYYPVSDLFRVVRDSDGLQLDFMATIHGVRSFAGAKARATTVDVGGAPILVASLEDSSGASAPLVVPAIWPCYPSWRRPLKKPVSRRARLAAVRRESERALVDMIRRWQALPPGRRTNFLRVRVAPGRTAL